MIPKMYCISCRKLLSRRRSAEAEFLRAGISVEFFDGVYGPDLNLVPAFPKWDDPGSRITAGYVGLHLSNLLLMTVALERNDDPIIIFEDDVRLPTDFVGELEKSIAALPPDWDSVSLGHCCTEDKPTVRLNDRVAEIRYPLCAHAVLYRKRVLPLIVDMLKSVCNSHFDIQMYHLVWPHVRHYSFVPPIAFQDLSDSLSEAKPIVSWASLPGPFDYARIYDEQLDRVAGPCSFAEVGSRQWKSTAYMAQEIKRRYKPVRFFAVEEGLGSTSPLEANGDNSADERGAMPTWQRTMTRCGVSDQVTPIPLPSVAAAARFENRSLRFIFIDGKREFQAVVDDIRAWRPKLAQGGVMAGHGWDCAAVQQAVRHECRRFRTWEKCWIVD